jgi:succinate-acetate transporter protein
MADEKPMQIKYAMADVLGLFVISIFTFLVAGLGLDANTGAIIEAVALPVSIATFIVAYIAFVNDNLLGTAIFGPLAVFFLGFFVLSLPADMAIVSVTGVDIAMLLGFIGIIIFIDAVVAFLGQPVRMLPILLFIAAFAFFATALFYNSPNDTMKMVFGVLWLIYSLLSLYMAPAIMLLVMKGKPILPLLIKK